MLSEDEQHAMLIPMHTFWGVLCAKKSFLKLFCLIEETLGPHAPFLLFPLHARVMTLTLVPALPSV